MITLYVVNQKGPIELRDESMTLLNLRTFSSTALTYLLKCVYADVKQKEPPLVTLPGTSIQIPGHQLIPSYTKTFDGDLRTYEFENETYLVSFSHLT
jgi:hypothetical protein